MKEIYLTIGEIAEKRDDLWLEDLEFEVEEQLETSDGERVNFLGEIRDFLMVRPQQLSVG